jgi:hypothetical protein
VLTAGANRRPTARRVFAYLYAGGNPVKYNDPSGHFACANDDSVCNNAYGKFADGNGGWSEHGTAVFANADILNAVLAEMGITFLNSDGSWTLAEQELIGQGVVALMNKVSNYDNVNGPIHLRGLLGGGAWFVRGGAGWDGPNGDGVGGFAAYVGGGQVAQGAWLGIFNRTVNVFDNLFRGSDDSVRGRVTHELAHVMDFNAAGGYQWLSGNVPVNAGFDAGAYAASNVPLEWFAEVTAMWVYGNSYREALGLEPALLPVAVSQFLDQQLGMR